MPDQFVPESDQTIRQTIGAVFRQHAYDRTVQESVWSRFWNWVFRKLGELFDVVTHARATHWIVFTVVIGVVVAILARAIYLAASDEGLRRQGRERRGVHRDPWLEAKRLAERGEYSAAAHELYKALLDAMARRGEVVLHTSKTIGDYGRELRQRSLPIAVPYRTFARSYETVVYGSGTCDQSRYERLLAMVLPMVGRPTRDAA